jgi:isochorismate pyruvate lyase
LTGIDRELFVRWLSRKSLMSLPVFSSISAHSSAVWHRRMFLMIDPVARDWRQIFFSLGASSFFWSGLAQAGAASTAPAINIIPNARTVTFVSSMQGAPISRFAASSKGSGTLDIARRGAIRRCMTSTILPGEACTTMAEVRAGVDQVDCEIVKLLARRFAYMDAAARIKPERGQVRDEARKAEVIANARANARAAGLPEDVIAALWDRLVEASIAYEFVEFDRR